MTMAFYPALNAAILIISAWAFSSGLYLTLRSLLRHMSELVRTERRHLLRMKQIARRGPSYEQPNRIVRQWQYWRRELELLLKATQGERYQDSSLQRFVLLTIATACSISTVGYFVTTDARFSLFLGLLALAAPVIYQRISLRSLQIQSGYDLADAIGVLVSKYKVTRGNMRLALQLSSQEVSSEPIRRHFMNWLREELNYVDAREMEKAVEEFIYSIQTSFAKQLGLTVLKGLLRGENVENTLMAIDKNIHKQIDMLRDEGDSSSEVLQLSWLHVLLFPLLMLLMIIFMGYNSTVHYQLETEQGRFWLTTTVCFIAGSLLLAVWFRRPPNDY